MRLYMVFGSRDLQFRVQDLQSTGVEGAGCNLGLGFPTLGVGVPPKRLSCWGGLQNKIIKESRKPLAEE